MLVSLLVVGILRVFLLYFTSQILFLEVRFSFTMATAADGCNMTSVSQEPNSLSPNIVRERIDIGSFATGAAQDDILASQEPTQNSGISREEPLEDSQTTVDIGDDPSSQPSATSRSRVRYAKQKILCNSSVFLDPAKEAWKSCKHGIGLSLSIVLANTTNCR